MKKTLNSPVDPGQYHQPAKWKLLAGFSKLQKDRELCFPIHLEFGVYSSVIYIHTSFDSEN